MPRTLPKSVGETKVYPRNTKKGQKKNEGEKQNSASR